VTVVLEPKEWYFYHEVRKYAITVYGNPRGLSDEQLRDVYRYMNGLVNLQQIKGYLVKGPPQINSRRRNRRLAAECSVAIKYGRTTAERIALLNDISVWLGKGEALYKFTVPPLGTTVRTLHGVKAVVQKLFKRKTFNAVYQRNIILCALTEYRIGSFGCANTTFLNWVAGRFLKKSLREELVTSRRRFQGIKRNLQLVNKPKNSTECMGYSKTLTERAIWYWLESCPPDPNSYRHTTIFSGIEGVKGYMNNHLQYSTAESIFLEFKQFIRDAEPFLVPYDKDGVEHFPSQTWFNLRKLICIKPVRKTDFGLCKRHASFAKLLEDILKVARNPQHHRCGTPLCPRNIEMKEKCECAHCAECMVISILTMNDTDFCAAMCCPTNREFPDLDCFWYPPIPRNQSRKAKKRAVHESQVCGCIPLLAKKLFTACDGWTIAEDCIVPLNIFMEEKYGPADSKRLIETVQPFAWKNVKERFAVIVPEFVAHHVGWKMSSRFLRRLCDRYAGHISKDAAVVVMDFSNNVVVENPHKTTTQWNNPLKFQCCPMVFRWRKKPGAKIVDGSHRLNNRRMANHSVQLTKQRRSCVGGSLALKRPKIEDRKDWRESIEGYTDPRYSLFEKVEEESQLEEWQIITVNKDPNHDWTSALVNVGKAVEELKKKANFEEKQFKKLIGYSDGSTKEFRNRGFIVGLTEISEKEGIDIQWNYTEAEHGKYISDGCGGSAKRQARNGIYNKELVYSIDVDFQKTWAKYLNEKESSFVDRVVVDVSDRPVNHISCVKYTKEIFGITKINAFWISGKNIRSRPYSCYCKDCVEALFAAPNGNCSRREMCGYWSDVFHRERKVSFRTTVCCYNYIPRKMADDWIAEQRLNVKWDLEDNITAFIDPRRALEKAARAIAAKAAEKHRKREERKLKEDTAKKKMEEAEKKRKAKAQREVEKRKKEEAKALRKRLREMKRKGIPLNPPPLANIEDVAPVVVEDVPQLEKMDSVPANMGSRPLRSIPSVKASSLGNRQMRDDAVIGTTDFFDSYLNRNNLKEMPEPGD